LAKTCILHLRFQHSVLSVRVHELSSDLFENVQYVLYFAQGGGRGLSHGTAYMTCQKAEATMTQSKKRTNSKKHAIQILTHSGAAGTSDVGIETRASDGRDAMPAVTTAC
jgi:hypothetical protein